MILNLIEINRLRQAFLRDFIIRNAIHEELFTDFDLDKLIPDLKAFIAQAEANGQTCWFDIDGTIVEDADASVLTNLGEWIKNTKSPDPLHVFSIGGDPENVKNLTGLNDVIPIEAVGDWNPDADPEKITTLTDITHPEITEGAQKKVEYLVDNIDQPYSTNVLDVRQYDKNLSK